MEANIDKKKENRGERILSLEHCCLVVNSLPSFRFKGCMQLSALQIYVRLKRTLWYVICFNQNFNTQMHRFLVTTEMLGIS